MDTVIYADKEKSMLDKRMDMPLCQGMGFVTSNFIGLTPLMISDHGVINMTRVDYKPNVTKYRVGLGNKSVWVLYAFHARNTTPLELKQKDGDKILATGPFTGFIQAAKVEVTGTVGGVTSDDIEAALDKSAGSYCSYVAYTSSVKNNVGYYEFHFGQRGIKSQKKNMVRSYFFFGISLADGFTKLMFALPHLVESFAPETQARSNPKFTMLSAAKGPMVAVIGAVWRMVEKELPVNIGWNPLSNGTSDISPGNLKLIAATAKQEIDEYVLTEPSDHDTKSLYHSGKRLHKYAQLCLATSEVLNDESLVKKCWDQLKDHFGFFAANLQRDKLLYDITW